MPEWEIPDKNREGGPVGPVNKLRFVSKRQFKEESDLVCTPLYASAAASKISLQKNPWPKVFPTGFPFLSTSQFHR